MEDKYEQAKTEREKHIRLILNSTSAKKVIVAGPGTGKTYLFKEVLRGKTNTLTLSFVNSLVEDLALELYGLSDVRTLHGFARGVLVTILKKEIKIHPHLSRYIREDAQILLQEDIDFNKIFHERDDSNARLAFYEKRRLQYDYYGYADVIFATVKRFESDNSTIPSYEQILVDEFQDFNLLEVALIDLLALKNPVLLAGDDDQALYHFKQASAKHIRERHGESMQGYAPFNLPFCARCPQVVVDVANDLINAAQKNGHLVGRIKKPYSYFIDAEKDKISATYPTISHTFCYEKQFAWFIEKSIADIALQLKAKFSVLIISPYQRKSQDIVNALRNKGLTNIEFSEKLDERALALLDGFNLLCDNIKDNLGWRIIAPFTIAAAQFAELIVNSEKSSKTIQELLPPEIVADVKKTVRALKIILAGKPLSTDILPEIYKRFNIDSNNTAIEFLKEQFSSLERKTGNPAIRKIPIKATTIQSSKGLSADVVFITHVDDRYLIGDSKDITDHQICNFLVALTRAKKKVFLLSSVKATPTFLSWISKDKIREIT